MASLDEQLALAELLRRANQGDDNWEKLALMTPQQQQAALAPQLLANNLPNRNAFLQRQIEQATALRAPEGSGPAHTSVAGSIFGGLGKGIDKFMGARERKQLNDAMYKNMTAMEDPSRLYTPDYIRWRAGSGNGDAGPMGGGDYGGGGGYA